MTTECGIRNAEPAANAETLAALEIGSRPPGTVFSFWIPRYFRIPTTTESRVSSASGRPNCEYDFHVLLSGFSFDLPAELIAQTPAAERSASRLMVVNRATGRIEHAHTRDLPSWLRDGDLLALNNTRVIPARLLGHRVPSGGSVECFLLRRIHDDLWDALVHPGQKLRPGARIRFDGPDMTLQAEIAGRSSFGRRQVRLWRDDGGTIDAAIDAIGQVPLPPYIKRAPTPGDRERYQTVYARVRGSVAAPTAGLHLTEDVLAACAARGVERTEITLHVGYGTFQPIRTTVVEEHTIDPEPYHIEPAAAAAIDRALDEGRRVIAVGTTTTRTLEAVAREHHGRIVAGSGMASLFIYPGFTFNIVSGLLTNFHLPQSSLLLLVAAFAGRELILEAYRKAVERQYRFYSYGDAMLIT
jgi:S-adenosylmethionine:tRNA ribosyltransferase-isomerase